MLADLQEAGRAVHGPAYMLHEYKEPSPETVVDTKEIESPDEPSLTEGSFPQYPSLGIW